MKHPLTILYLAFVYITLISLSTANLAFLDDNVYINTQVLPLDGYDTLVLDLNYLPTLCKIEEKNSTKCINKVKSLRTKDNFTIHGLWPSTNTPPQPACKGKIVTVTFTPALKQLEEDMNDYWASMTGSNTSLWVHEFNKHGECYSKDHIYYFQTTINLYKSLNLQDLIPFLFPGTSSKVETTFNKLNDDVRSFLKGEYHKLYCLSDETGVQYLSEIKIYFDTNMKLKKTPRGGNCNFKKPITILFL